MQWNSKVSLPLDVLANQVRLPAKSDYITDMEQNS